MLRKECCFVLQSTYFGKLDAFFLADSEKLFTFATDSVASRGLRYAVSITYCKHFTKIILNIKIWKIFEYRGIMDIKMLALITYKFIYHFYGRIVIISYRRGLLFYYLYTGVSRCLMLNNRQRPRYFYARS